MIEHDEYPEVGFPSRIAQHDCNSVRDSGADAVGGHCGWTPWVVPPQLWGGLIHSWQHVEHHTILGVLR